MSKNKTISLRVNEEIFDFVSTSAQSLDISKSEFIIQSVLNTSIHIDDKKKDRLKSPYALNNISNKLDQIAKKCNISKNLDIAILDELILLEESILDN